MRVVMAVSLLALCASGNDMAYPTHRADHGAVEAQITGMPTCPNMKLGPTCKTPNMELDPACKTPLLSIYSAMPTLPPALASYGLAHPATDPDHYSVPDSLTAEQQSYTSVVYDFFCSHTSEIASALNQCSLSPAQSSVFSRAYERCTERAFERCTDNPATKSASMDGEVVTITGTATAVAATPRTSQATKVNPVVEVTFTVFLAVVACVLGWMLGGFLFGPEGVIRGI